MSRMIWTIAGCTWLASQIWGNAAFAQRNAGDVNAATQAREHLGQSHTQAGAISRGYRPYTIWTYTRTAQTNNQALTAYGTNCRTIEPAVASEHVAEVRRSISQATRELAKFDDAAAEEADVKLHVDAVRTNYAACEKLCKDVEKMLGERPNPAQLCAYCGELDRELKSAEAHLEELHRKLGIPAPAAPAANPKSPS